jgi:MtrB/PioB family decaheme-associated outer membrane protein
MRRWTWVVIAVAAYGLLLMPGKRGIALAEDGVTQDYPRAEDGRVSEATGLSGLLPGWNVHGLVEVGGQTLSGNLQSPTLQEYRDLDGKPTIPALRIYAEDPLRAKFLEFGGRDMTRTDGSFFLRGGQYNAYRFDFDYDRLPHLIGLNRSMIYTDAGMGDLRLTSDQCGNVAAFNATPGTTPAQRGAIQGSVNCLLRPTPLGHQTDTARIGFRATPFPDVEMKATYSRMSKVGTRPFGGVLGTPGSSVTEFAAPRDERIHDMSTGIELARDWYQVAFNYNLSLFENSVNHVQWENVCGTGAACGNPSGFGRIAMLPDNVAHMFSGSGGMSLPWWQTRLSGVLSYSLWRQDKAFVPHSTIAGSGNTTDAGATSPNASMDVLLTNINLTSRPLQNVTLLARYRYYHVDNNTPAHSFTNVLRPGDLNPNAGRITNLPISFRKQNMGTDVVWRILPKLTAKAGYEWEHWGRSFREVAQLDEHTGKASLEYRPKPWMTTRTTYSHGVRTIGADGYVPMGGNAIALPQFRKFDQADRTRDKGEFFVQLTPVETVTVSGTFFAQQDNFFNTTYGLKDSRSYGYTWDIAWTPVERLTLFSGYAHDDYQSFQQNCNIGFGQTICNPASTYFARPRDLLDTVHGGFSLIAIPDRLDFNVDYRYTFGRSKYGMAGTPGGPIAAQPAEMPPITNVFHVIQASTRYRMTPQWTVKLLYMYERYTQSDFTVDNVTPSLANLVLNGFTTTSPADVRSVLMPILHPAYEAHFTGFSLAYAF